MSRLFLLRHAKAGWAEPGMRDFDRPLEPLGRTDADAIGAAMRASAYIPDLVLCSTAKRARETLDWVASLMALDRETPDLDALEQTLGVALKASEDIEAVRGERLAGILARAATR